MAEVAKTEDKNFLLSHPRRRTTSSPEIENHSRTQTVYSIMHMLYGIYLENIFEQTIAKIQTHKFVVTGPGNDTLIHQVVMSETAYTFCAHMAGGGGIMTLPHVGVCLCGCSHHSLLSALGVIMNCVGAGG